MNEENKSIHEFDFNLICDYFSQVERQGPGSPEVTRKALSFIENLPQDARIADIGCGTGGQTIVLAQNTTGHITAVDLFPHFIEVLEQKVNEQGLQGRFSTVVESMLNLSFQPETLDLIWSEGAIYNIGFERGLNEWHKFLKKGGYIAVSEGTWFTNERPAEIEDFWMDAYPEIDVVSTKVAQMQDAGYKPIAHFMLPTSCWTDFYAPMNVAQKQFLDKYKNNKVAQELVSSQQYEMKLYDKYKDYYGYVFYIGQKL